MASRVGESGRASDADDAAAAAPEPACELSACEAAFLAFEVGCLVLRGDGRAPMSGEEAARALCGGARASALLAAYSHLRWKHWWVRGPGRARATHARGTCAARRLWGVPPVCARVARHTSVAAAAQGGSRWQRLRW